MVDLSAIIRRASIPGQGMKSDFVSATKRYEKWLGQQVKLRRKELQYKHTEMASTDDPFPFFRGTYYRWAETWPRICKSCHHAPQVLAVGDLHVENFGTWRDKEGRLVWGVNDFDEADQLPFTNDLVRLAASASFGADGAAFQMNLKNVCRAILAGYVHHLRLGGRPFVLEERHLQMRRLAVQQDRDPVVFWRKLKRDLRRPKPPLPSGAETILKAQLPEAGESLQIFWRVRTGMGSLGKPRLVAMTRINDCWVAREAKALTAPATVSLQRISHNGSWMSDMLSKAVRCADPFLTIQGDWIVRRLAPRCSRVTLEHLKRIEDEELLFASMGAETANIHCGTPKSIDTIRKWLRSQKTDWLEAAAEAMVDATRQDWKVWRKHYEKDRQKPR